MGAVVFLSPGDRKEVEALLAQGVCVARASTQGTPVKRSALASWTNSITTVDQWAERVPQGGLIARLGSGFSLLTISARAKLERLEAEFGPLPLTVEVGVPNKARMLYLRTPAHLSSQLFSGEVHLRGVGEVAPVPPCPTRDIGARYRWRRAPSVTTIEELPSKWIEAAQMREAA